MSGLDTVAVAGLGLIGGSVARDLAAAGVRVLGWDLDEPSVDAALREGVVSAALGPGFEGLEDADVLVVAVPVGAAAAVLEAALPRLARARLVTDTGSTKASIVAAAERLGLGERFVGAHPLAGDHRAGWEASRTGLFAGATIYLCPTQRSSAAAVSLARELWSGIGGVPLEIGADGHDRLLAWTSHLPQVVSTALANALASQGIARAALGPGGRDVTRLAASPAGVWLDILRDNHANVAEALAAFEDHIRSTRTAITADDPTVIRTAFGSAQEWSVSNITANEQVLKGKGS
ncbi:MAG: prephenate dehydrogenase [Longimicrobiaceae bacterium]